MQAESQLQSPEQASEGVSPQLPAKQGSCKKPFFIADNTHEIVEEKLEKLREEREAAENKKRPEGEEDEEPKKKKNTQKLILCTFQTKYRVVKKSCRKLDFKLCEDQNLDWDLYWADTGLQPTIIQKMQSYQRINHYPGMASLAHKHNLSRNLKRMQKIFNQEYDFFPKTWILPSDLSDFKQQFTKKKAKTFIVKPVASCQGRGIFLTRDFESIDMKAGEQYVVQRYMHRPYLIDGLKFDMRIYVLVYGVDPLRIFVFREGLARFATEEYVGPYRNNLDNLFMHLTNYAINKNAENFEANEDSAEDDTGHKRSVSSVLKHIEETENKPGITAQSLWEQIDDIAVKTLISAQPQLCHSFRSLQPDDLENSMCFEILGIDIFIDDKIKPWLIEVNSLASFATDSPLDKKIKFDVVYETIAMLNLSSKRKRKAKRDKTEQFNRRQYKDAAMSKQQRDTLRKQLQAERDKWDDFICSGFAKVYPSLDPDQQELYSYMLDQSKHMFNEFTNGNIRSYPQTNGFVRADPRNMSKTNPIPKAKAADLADQLPGTVSPQKSNIQQRIVELKTNSALTSSPKIHRGIPNPNNPYGQLRFQQSIIGGNRQGEINGQESQGIQGINGVYNLTVDEQKFMQMQQRQLYNNMHQYHLDPNVKISQMRLTQEQLMVAKANQVNQLKQQIQMFKQQNGIQSNHMFLEQKYSKSDSKKPVVQLVQQQQQQELDPQKPKLECIAKTLQKQFPLIKLEQSLLVNGCMNSCPVHGGKKTKSQAGQAIQQFLSHKPKEGFKWPTQQNPNQQYQQQLLQNNMGYQNIRGGVQPGPIKQQGARSSSQKMNQPKLFKSGSKVIVGPQPVVLQNMNTIQGVSRHNNFVQSNQVPPQNITTNIFNINMNFNQNN